MYSAYLASLANFVPIMATFVYGKSTVLSTQQQKDLDFAAFLTILLPAFILPLSGYLVDKIG
jgi:hypothetical protein